ncbi:uncharacterized protein LOC129218444 [Uloborus diversus]|uniref:uncharacterized protein LOC129218444 n=1 Tax=Uloborus diversus TaxID=327109 RepID=UPI00240A8DB7|nr:uncharacterized protein LOC129218444 [Uloborus diversus]XP_054708690.1 uncharacterized protein LOC129218444 [Uloborus diversus]
MSMEKEVLKFFVGSCQCEDCSKPYGTSILSKLLDESKAYSVLEESEDIIRVANVLSELDLEAKIDPDLVNSILKKQEGVLGDTNSFRIRLLAFCLFMHISDSDKEKRYEELIKCMEKAFGNYYREVRLLYSILRRCSARSGNFAKALKLTEKIGEFKRMGFKPL